MRHAPEDQRTWMRFHCNLRAHFNLIGDLENHEIKAQVLNVSASGIGLLVNQFIETGVLLNLNLVAKEGAAVRTILSCVVHVSKQAEGEWALGCNFIRELTEEDFRILVQ